MDKEFKLSTTKLKDAVVRVMNEEVMGYAKTDAEGNYSIFGLAAGKYVLSVQSNDYEPFFEADIRIDNNIQKVRNISLVPAPITGGQTVPMEKIIERKIPIYTNIAFAHDGNVAYAIVAGRVGVLIVQALVDVLTVVLIVLLRNIGSDDQTDKHLEQLEKIQKELENCPTEQEKVLTFQLPKGKCQLSDSEHLHVWDVGERDFIGQSHILYCTFKCARGHLKTLPINLGKVLTSELLEIDKRLDEGKLTYKAVCLFFLKEKGKGEIIDEVDP